MNDMKVIYTDIKKVRPYKRVLKKTNKQIEKAQKFLEQFGFVVPIVVDQDSVIVIGEYFFFAAQKLNHKNIPIVYTNDLSKAEIKILRISYDRILRESEWDLEALKLEFEEIKILLPDIDLTETGFDIPEIDTILDF